MSNSNQVRQLGGVAQAITRFAGRLYQPPSSSISGVNPSSWPSPLQPVQPIAPKGSEPLAWGFWQGQNLNYTPRAESEWSSAKLRWLATYPLARACIDLVKDQVSQMPWRVQLKRMAGETEKEHKARQKGDDNIGKITQFLEQPNPEYDWQELCKRELEDLLVIDAPATLVRRFATVNGKPGKVAELRWTDGADIVRYIDDNGYMPMGVDENGKPDTAFAQNWENIPRVELAWNQLIYRPKNIVPRNGQPSSYLYGTSPTQSAAPEIIIGMNRLDFVSKFYTSGTLTDMIQVVPPGISPKQIREAEEFENSEMGGNLAKRRQLRLLQGFATDGKDQVLFPKAGALTDQYDDLHIRRICFMYGVSPQRLLHMQMRATAEASQEASEQEGLTTWVKWVEGWMNHALRLMNYGTYEFTLDASRTNDALKEAQVAQIYVNSGIRTRNEVRESEGDDPGTQPEMNMFTVTTAQGIVPLDISVQQAQSVADNAGNPPAPKVPGVAAKPKPKPTKVMAGIQELRKAVEALRASR